MEWSPPIFTTEMKCCLKSIENKKYFVKFLRGKYLKSYF